MKSFFYYEATKNTLEQCTIFDCKICFKEQQRKIQSNLRFI